MSDNADIRDAPSPITILQSLLLMFWLMDRRWDGKLLAPVGDYHPPLVLVNDVNDLPSPQYFAQSPDHTFSE